MTYLTFVTLSQCLAKIHFNLSNIFQNILRVPCITFPSLIDTYPAQPTFIDHKEEGTAILWRWWMQLAVASLVHIQNCDFAKIAGRNSKPKNLTRTRSLSKRNAKSQACLRRGPAEPHTITPCRDAHSLCVTLSVEAFPSGNTCQYLQSTQFQWQKEQAPRVYCQNKIIVLIKWTNKVGPEATGNKVKRLNSNSSKFKHFWGTNAETKLRKKRRKRGRKKWILPAAPAMSKLSSVQNRNDTTNSPLFLSFGRSAYFTTRGMQSRATKISQELGDTHGSIFSVPTENYQNDRLYHFWRLKLHRSRTRSPKVEKYQNISLIPFQTPSRFVSVFWNGSAR